MGNYLHTAVYDYVVKTSMEKRRRSAEVMIYDIPGTEAKRSKRINKLDDPIPPVSMRPPLSSEDSPNKNYLKSRSGSIGLSHLSFQSMTSFRKLQTKSKESKAALQKAAQVDWRALHAPLTVS